eukprot:PhM_4_TR10066/c3_g2_i1/m.25800
MTCDDNSNSRTEHFRKMFDRGFHPTASRAAMLLRMSTYDPINIEYSLCAFTTEHVLSFCVDANLVLVGDVTEESWDVLSGDASVCLIVDDHEKSDVVSRTAWTPLSHIIFAAMSYRRALEWLWQNDVRSRPGMSIDMYNTYADEKGPFMPFSSMQVLELALPSTVAATSIPNGFLRYSSRLKFIDLSSSLTNVSEIGYYFHTFQSKFRSSESSEPKVP